MKTVSKIRCEACGELISKSNFTKHQRRHLLHPESFEIPKYRVQHDGLKCIYCFKECKNDNSLRNHERLCKNNPDRQISPFSKESNNYNHVAWSKGLTKATDARLAQKAERARLKYKISPAPNKGRPLSEEHKKKISETILEKSRNGEWHVSLAKKMHISYKGVDLHGTWEQAYAMYLDDNNINWIRCKKRFTYYFEDKLHYYTPDFYLPESDTYIEIKGYATDKDRAKWEQFPKSENLNVLFGPDLLALGIQVSL